MAGTTKLKPAARIASGSFLLAVALVLPLSSGAATGTTPKPMDLPSRVLAHIPLAVAPGSQMVLEKQGDKHYLYIQNASKDGYTVVEVTQPEFPGLVKRSDPAVDPTAAKADVAGATVTVADAPDPAVKTSIHSIANVPETINVQDVSDPQKTVTLQTIKNVTSFLPDGGRGVFYVTNDEGLWVLKLNRQVIAPTKKKSDCDIYPTLAQKSPDCADTVPTPMRPGKPH